MNAILIVAVVVALGAVVVAVRSVRALERARRSRVERERMLGQALRGVFDLAAYGGMLGSFAHAANNRLTAIMTYIDLSECTDIDPDDLRVIRQLAAKAARQLADDIDTLQGSARRRLPARERVPVAEAARKAMDLHTMLEERPLSMSLDVPGEVAVDIEPGRLELALLRLCRFAQGTGAHTLAVRGAAVVVEQRDPARPALRPGDYCRLECDLRGAVVTDALLEPLTEPGHVISRLHAPEGVEFAPLEAFAHSLRGWSRLTRNARDQPYLEVYLPLAEPLH